MKPKTQRQIMQAWLQTQAPANRLADQWEWANFRRDMIRAFERGVKFARTGK